MLHRVHALHFIAGFATNLSVREGRSLKTLELRCCLCILSSYRYGFSRGTTAVKILCVKMRETGVKTVCRGNNTQSELVIEADICWGMKGGCGGEWAVVCGQLEWNCLGLV